MGFNFEVFQEPRGVMRIFQFIFAIWAFAKTVDYTNEVTLNYCSLSTTSAKSATLVFGYPYRLDRIHTSLSCQNQTNSDEVHEFSLVGDFSSDAQFFVATGVISMLYCIGISLFYVTFNDLYKSNTNVPMVDFVLSLSLAVFWLSGSAAWANGLVGLKTVTSPEKVKSFKGCVDVKCFSVFVGSFSGLNISIVLGFLNFFLWAFDLWFLYKETQWFNNPNKAPVSSSLGVSAA